MRKDDLIAQIIVQKSKNFINMAEKVVDSIKQQPSNSGQSMADNPKKRKHE